MPERFRVKVTKLAEFDIEEIWSFIAADSRDNASKHIGKLYSQMKTLERFPLRCQLISENELLGSQYRHLIFRHYRTIFRVSKSTVYVMRVVHAARLLDVSTLE